MALAARDDGGALRERVGDVRLDLQHGRLSISGPA
jgi:hypothetical protein